ncbi:HTTM domain-containing protein [Streptomyces lacrimifluminis]|uniref:HTTM domain-containing protein n=1 Tax=Streptomyces lacrimifluminis TaxID=1500077 RepID=A0A917P6L6_9ACTN|nr:HTTM domain-containing protein [Streptomyces lacrimifluminis]GGJ64249.1 HTTM domain-containing protein [Streptomyces lacrimifluminis]
METEPVPAPHPRTVQRAEADAPRRAPDHVRATLASLTERPVSLYAAAVLRIGYGLLYLVFLLREFPHRHQIWGPGSPWTPELARQLFDQTGWVSILTLSDSRAYFEACYALAVVVSALFALGWRTRAVSVLFAVVVASFHGRAIFMTDGGDNLILLMAVYLVLTACGRRWSLDARRTRLRTCAGTAESMPVDRIAGGLRPHLRTSRRTLTAVLHNCGMFVIAAQVCFLYGSAGLYKVQGGSWGNGTALHYVLNLDLFRPWPGLSLMVDEHDVLISVACYLTVLLQVAFPFVLFGRLKYPVLTMLLGMHLGIAVLMGLPLFSGAMIIADAVFLPDRFYRALGRLWQRTAQGAGSGKTAEADRPLRAPVPAQSEPAG